MTAPSHRAAAGPDPRSRLDPQEASERLSAYSYGNILVLAALVAVPVADVGDWRAALLVAGTGFSTFVAHLFSDSLGAQLLDDRESDHERGRHLLRGSLPILSATSVPLALMVVGGAGWLDETVSLRLAEAWCVSRIALTAFFIARYRGRPVSLLTWVASIGLGLVGLLVVGAKIVLTH